MSIAQPSTAGTAQRASGSSFYLAMRILPREQRQAMFDVYAFCRAVDDIADSDAPRPQRLESLADWRRAIDRLYQDHDAATHDDLGAAVARFGLRREDFHAVIDGMEMDAREDVRAPDWAVLDLYCDRVASAVGRLSARIFGMEEGDGVALAHHLGRALQMTNILRDLDEDAAMGRLYLPREALDAAGIHTDKPNDVLSHAAVGSACLALADRAKQHFQAADDIMARAPRHTVRAPRIMAEAYRHVLDDLIVRGWASPRQRVHVSRTQLLKVALRHAFL